MQDKLDELHYIYKMIGNYGFCTVQELLDGYNSQKEVIDKTNKYLHTRGIQQCYNGRHYRGLDGLQVQVLENILKEGKND